MNSVKRHGKNQHGFTLFEVLVAMAILAILSTQLTTVTRQNSDYQGRLEEKTAAHWVAMNQWVFLETQPTWPSLGDNETTVEMMNRSWRVNTVTTVSQNPLFRLIEIRVSPVKTTRSIGQKTGNQAATTVLKTLMADRARYAQIP